MALHKKVPRGSRQHASEVNAGCVFTFQTSSWALLGHTALSYSGLRKWSHRDPSWGHTLEPNGCDCKRGHALHLPVPLDPWPCISLFAFPSQSARRDPTVWFCSGKTHRLHCLLSPIQVNADAVIPLCTPSADPKKVELDPADRALAWAAHTRLLGWGDPLFSLSGKKDLTGV